jgi:cyclopropane-fatty-acyl-phospholipid synthase
MTTWLDTLLEKQLLPDSLIRMGIRRLLTAKHKALMVGGVEAQQQYLNTFLTELRQSPIAIETEAANEQHYELPPVFFDTVLGKRRKYSSGLWQAGCTTLDAAEEAMLHLYAERAELRNGQRMLDLGCGWGSLSLWLAEHYPASQIVGLSNSNNQRLWIMAEAERKGLHNLTILTGNIVDVEMPEDLAGFDRICSIEMMEHMKNYARLFEKLSRWMTPEGKLFVHIFTHHAMPYHFEDNGPNDWLTRYFFSGGTMPSHDLLLHFQDHLTLEQQWAVNGQHYEKTANAWLHNMDANRASLWPLIQATYGKYQAGRWWQYWRIFFMACAELWGYKGGDTWLVSHYRFVNGQKTKHGFTDQKALGEKRYANSQH